jgi:thioredoxin-related protein
MHRRDFGRIVVSTFLASAGWKPLFAAPPAKSKITWQKTLRAAHDVAVEQKKPLLLVFGASWCTFCHKMHRETFTDRNLAALIEREFIAMTLDFDKDTKAVEILEVEQLPCTVVLSYEGDLLLKHVGFAKADAYQKKLQQALEKRTQIELLQGTSPAKKS